MRKKRMYILIISIVLFMVVLIFGTIIKGDVLYSENENRYLQLKPDFKFSTLFSGEFEEDYEEYLSDQVIFRETWIKIMSNSLKNIGIKDVNGAYLLKNRGFSLRITKLDADLNRFDKNLARLNDFCQLYSNTISLIIPTQEYVLNDYLPSNALTFDEESLFFKLSTTLGESFLDIRDELRGDVFYKTDHHWNNEGVKIGYIEFCDKLNINPEISQELVLTDTFRGTLYSKVLIGDYFDEIKTDSDSYMQKYHVNCDGKEYESIFFNDCLNEKDKYKVFLGGNYAKVTIENEFASSNNSLLIIKDSYSNSLIPYLTKNFKNITMIDPRYFNGSIMSLVSNFDQVLVIFSMDSFLNEVIVFD